MLRKSLIAFATFIAIITGGAITSNAGASEVLNLGHCHQDNPFDSAIAPGQTGMGAFIIINKPDGTIEYRRPAAFQGWMGCAKP